MHQEATWCYAFRFEAHCRAHRTYTAVDIQYVFRCNARELRGEVRTTMQDSLCLFRVRLYTFVMLIIRATKDDVICAGDDVGQFIWALFIDQNLTKTIVLDTH